MTSPDTTSFRRISAQEALALIAAEPTATIFDVRSPTHYRAGHLPGAAQLDQDRVPLWIRKLDKQAPVLIYCYHGNSSQAYAQTFVDFRFARVYSIDGGYEALAAVCA